MNRLLKIALLLTLLITGAIVTRAQTIIIPPSLGVMSSTQTSRNTATLSGNLLRTGGENPTVKIAWGTQDRGIQPLPDLVGITRLSFQPISLQEPSLQILPFLHRVMYIISVLLPAMPLA